MMGRKSKRPRKPVNRKEPWRKHWVLARKDPDGPYGPENCHWRPARSEKEARMGIEEWIPGEPDVVPLTDEQKEQLATMTDPRDRETFLIWARMLWRAKYVPEAN
jgi:hypothetical protein